MADQKATARTAPTNDRDRKRSPSYPSSGLETCMKWTRRVWDAEKKSTMATTVAGKAMGYNTMSGAARIALAAMKKFGLLIEEGPERVRVSDDAIKYFLHPDEDEKARLLRSFAKRPPIIAEVLTEAVDELPSDENLNYRLVADKGFTEDAARTFIKALKETVRFAKLGPEHYGQSVPHPGDQATDNGDQAAERPRNSFTQDFLSTFDRPRGNVPPAQPPRSPSPNAFRVELSDGTWVSVEPSAALTASTFEELLDYLTVYKKVLEKRAAATSDDR